jgi:hypothetical protein
LANQTPGVAVGSAGFFTRSGQTAMTLHLRASNSSKSEARGYVLWRR